MVKKFRNFFKTLQKNKRRQTLFFVIAGVVVTILIISVAFFIMKAQSSKTLSVAIGEEPETLDPAISSFGGSSTIIANTFEGLMKIDADGKTVPGQAVSYSVSDDGLVYTFNISSSAIWSDGGRVKATDFIYAWNRAADNEINVEYAYLFDNIERTTKSEIEQKNKDTEEEESTHVIEDSAEEEILYLEAEGDSTLIVHLQKPDPGFIEKCALPIFSPVCEEVALSQKRVWGYTSEVFVSNGAYYLSGWETGSYLTLSRNEKYSGFDEKMPEQIKVYFTEDENEALSLFKNGTVDFTSHIPQDELDKLSKKKEFHSSCDFGTYYIGFNNGKEPFNDANVRLALTLAVDRSEIVKIVGDYYAEPANTVLSPSFLFADGKSVVECCNASFDATSDSHEENVARAKELLAKAGYPDGEGFPNFEYTYNDNSYHKQIAETVVSMWRENLGINCTLKSLNWQKFASDRSGENYDVVRCGSIVPMNDPLMVLENFTSDKNYFGWSISEYDSALQSLKNTRDFANRQNLITQAQNILISENVVCPLYWYKNSYLASKNLKNYYVTPSGTAYFTQLNIK